jgi:hypothetical protein
VAEVGAVRGEVEVGGVLGDDGVERGAGAEVPGAAAAGEEAAEVGVAEERGPHISHSAGKRFCHLPGNPAGYFDLGRACHIPFSFYFFQNTKICVATGSTDSLHTHQNDSYKIFIQVFIGINRVIFFCIKYIQIIVN